VTKDNLPIQGKSASYCK